MVCSVYGLLHPLALLRLQSARASDATSTASADAYGSYSAFINCSCCSLVSCAIQLQKRNGVIIHTVLQKIRLRLALKAR
jgi:hypothetical protein